MNRLKKPTSNYTVVPNEIFDLTNLSAEARFAYIYFLSRPEGWNVRITNVQKRLKCGREKTYRILKELKESGLLSYQALVEGGGVYTLHEITVSQKAECGKPVSGFSADIVSTERAVSSVNKLTGENAEKKKKPKEGIWDIAEQMGISRTLAGKMAKKHGKESVTNAMKETIAENPIEPSAFFLGKLKQVIKVGTNADWMIIPNDDDEMCRWADRHGYRKSEHWETYDQIRARLRSEVEARRNRSEAA